MRKGQTEVAGLLVIVVLLLVVGVIFLRFRLFDSGQDFAEVRSSVEASRLLKAALRLKTDSLALHELLSQCYEEQQCEAFREELGKVIRANLLPQEDFTYFLEVDRVELLRFGGCTRGIVGSSFTVREGVLYESRLVLCRK